MSHEEKNTILQIIVGAAINIWLILEIRQLYSNGSMDEPAAIQTWAETVFWVIVISIVAGIVLTVVSTVIFSVIEKFIFGEADYNFIMDERDKAIASSGDKITLSIVGSGFVILILGLKFGYEIMDCLVLLMFCFSFGGLIGEIAKLARYRMSV
jgi:hypothetical protein